MNDPVRTRISVSFTRQCCFFFLLYNNIKNVPEFEFTIFFSLITRQFSFHFPASLQLMVFPGGFGTLANFPAAFQDKIPINLAQWSLVSSFDFYPTNNNLPFSIAYTQSKDTNDNFA